MPSDSAQTKKALEEAEREVDTKMEAFEIVIHTKEHTFGEVRKQTEMAIAADLARKKLAKCQLQHYYNQCRAKLQKANLPVIQEEIVELMKKIYDQSKPNGRYALQRA